MLALAVPLLAAAQPTTYPATPEELLARLKPLPPGLKGWSIAPDPRSANGALVGSLLAPEAAATVLSYQPDWALQLQLVPQNPPEPVSVLVLRFADSLDAFGAFAAFRTPASEAANLRTISYWTGTRYYAWRDGFAVIVTPPGAGAPARATAEAAAEAIMTTLPVPDLLPLMMRLMPEARQVPYSLRYYKQNLLGRLPIGDALAAGYLENGTQLQMALIRTPNDAAARQGYCDVANLLAPGACGNPLALLGRQAQVIPTQQFGLAYLVQEGRYLILAINVHDREAAEGLLRITATEIRITR